MKIYLVTLSVCPLPSQLTIADLKEALLTPNIVATSLEAAKDLAMSEVRDANFGNEVDMSNWQPLPTSDGRVGWTCTNDLEDDEEIVAAIYEIDVN